MLGWEPAEVTTYVYDGDRLVKSVTVRESEFRDVDVAELLDLLVEDSKPRGAHGIPLETALSRDWDPSNLDGKGRFVVPAPTVDFAAKALSDAQNAFAKDHPDFDMSALRWTVQKKER